MSSSSSIGNHFLMTKNIQNIKKKLQLAVKFRFVQILFIGLECDMVCMEGSEISIETKHLLGIPDTSFKGRSTLTARSVLRSNVDPTDDKILQRKKQNT